MGESKEEHKGSSNNLKELGKALKWNLSRNWYMPFVMKGKPAYIARARVP